MNVSDGRRVRFFLVGAMVAAVVMSAGVASAQWFLPEVRLTTDAADQRWPEISGTKVVFEDYRDAHEIGDINDPETLYDIRVLDVVTKAEKNLTPFHTAQGRPAISGNNVVWNDHGHGTVAGGIYYHNLKSGVTRRLPISSGNELRISGNRLVYASSRGVGNNIFMFDLTTNKESRITTDGALAGVPDISGTKIVWQDHRNGLDFDVYLYDVVTAKTTRLTTNADDQEFPRISGSRVVWMDNRHGILDNDVYLYDVRTGVEQRITDEPERQFYPVISGNYIAWQDERHGDTEVYFYDVATSVESRVTSNTAYQGNPSVSGGRVVYEDHLRPGIDGMDVYMAELAIPQIFTKTSASIPYGGRARVIGNLRSATGTAVAGREVSLEVSKDKSTWTRVDTATTEPTGAYTLESSRFATRRYLRVRFVGDAEYPGGVSSTLLVKARLLYSSAPRLRTTTLAYGSTYKVWGYFKPEHRSGSGQIKVRAYRYQRLSNGTSGWVYKKTYATRTSNPSGLTYTKYTGYVRLPSRGTWRLRAYHAADTYNAASFSEYRNVRVR